MLYISRRALIGGLGAIFLLLLVGRRTARLWLSGIGRWLAVTPRLAQADAIVVLSNSSPARLMHGIELYRRGLAPELWYTGDVPFSTMHKFTDGQLARQFAIEQGVPAEAIHLLATTSTWEDGQEIAALAKRTGVRSILIVTDWYHGRRALGVVRQKLADSGITVYYSSTPALIHGPDNWWQQEDGLVAVVNELIRFGFYWWRYGLPPWQC